MVNCATKGTSTVVISFWFFIIAPSLAFPGLMHVSENKGRLHRPERAK